MSDATPELDRPGSLSGTLVDLAWCAACIAVFGALARYDPFFFTVDPTAETVASAVPAGVVAGVALVALSTESDRVRSVWMSNYSRRFAALFVSMMGLSLLIRVVPGWTVTAVLAGSLAAIPARLVAYARHRGE